MSKSRKIIVRKPKQASSKNETGIDNRIQPPIYRHPKGAVPGKPGAKPTKEQVSTMIDNRMLTNRVCKYIETFNVNQTMETTFQEVCLTLVPQGNTQGRRIADNIWIQRIEIRSNVNLANTDEYGLARVGMFRWKVSTALAIPTGIDLFQTFSVNPVLSFFNYERNELYTILYDEVLNCVGTPTTLTTHSQHWTTQSFDYNSMRVDFDLGTTTATNHLFLYWISDSINPPHPIFEFNVRVWYYDE